MFQYSSIRMLAILWLVELMGLTSSLIGQSSPQNRFMSVIGGEGDDRGNDVISVDGGFLVTGTTSSAQGIHQIWILKLKLNGEEIWSRKIDYEFYASGEAARELPDGNYLILAVVQRGTISNYDVLLIKIDRDGNEIWRHTYGGEKWDWGSQLAIMDDGGAVVVGWTSSFGVGGGDLWILRTDASGNEVWSRTLGGIEYDSGQSVVRTRDGGLIITGGTHSDALGNDDLWILKIDVAGHEEWRRVLGGQGYDEGLSVSQTRDGGYIIVGTTTATETSRSNGWLIRLNVGGGLEWIRTVDSGNWDWAVSVIEVNGGYVLAGSTLSMADGRSTVWLRRTDYDGIEIWVKTYSATGVDFAEAMVASSDGGFVIAGRSYRSDGNSDLLIIKTDAAGNYRP